MILKYEIKYEVFCQNGLASSFLFISLAENSALSIQVKPELEASLSSLFDIGIKTKDPDLFA